MHEMNNSPAAPGPYWVFHFSLRPSELANLSKESADVREASQPIWIKAPTRKWEVQGQEKVGVMSLLSS